MLTDTTKRLLRAALALVGWLMLIDGSTSDTRPLTDAEAAAFFEQATDI